MTDAATPTEPLLDITTKLFVATQNDALYLIDREPAPSNDAPRHDAEGNVIAKMGNLAHAARLAACWNACSGIATNDVASLPTSRDSIAAAARAVGTAMGMVLDGLNIDEEATEINFRDGDGKLLHRMTIADLKTRLDAALVAAGYEPIKAAKVSEVKEHAPTRAPTPSAEEVIERVRDVVSRQLCKPLDSFTNEANFISDMDADSLDTVEITMELESEFGIQIPDDDADKILTVQQAIDYVTSKVTA